MALITHYHSFLQSIDLHDIEINIQLVYSQLDTIKSQLHGKDTKFLYESQLNYLSTKIDKASTELRNLQPNRPKRGIVDGLGSIIKSISGNLDYTDALKYDHAISILNNNQDKLVNELSSRISLNKDWMTHHTQILSQIIDNQSKINNTIQLILKSSNYGEDIYIRLTKLNQLLTITGENIDDLLLELRRIENIIAFTRASSTHHSMIGIDSLSSIVAKLRTLYNKEQILDIELREFYDVILPSSYYSGTRLVLVLKIPIVTSDRYNLYKLSILPNKNNQIIIPPSPYIATNDETFVYIEAECPKLKAHYLCEEKFNRQILSQPDCIRKLLTEQSVDTTCKKMSIILTREAMEKLDDKYYALVLPEPTKVQLYCGSKEDHTVLKGSYLATIPRHCHLRTRKFMIMNEENHLIGQPIKISQFTNETAPTASAASLHLNTINLAELHRSEDKILYQPPLQLDDVTDSTLYHTTLPFYILVSGATLLAGILLWRRYFSSQSLKTPPVPAEVTTEDLYSEINHSTKIQNQTPATFSLKVLK